LKYSIKNFDAIITEKCHRFVHEPVLCG